MLDLDGTLVSRHVFVKGTGWTFYPLKSQLLLADFVLVERSTARGNQSVVAHLCTCVWCETSGVCGLAKLCKGLMWLFIKPARKHCQGARPAACLGAMRLQLHSKACPAPPAKRAHARRWRRLQAEPRGGIRGRAARLAPVPGAALRLCRGHHLHRGWVACWLGGSYWALS
jgi:hypothetical protein